MTARPSGRGAPDARVRGLADPGRDEAERFLRDRCTLREIHDLAQRWQVVRLLQEGLHYAEISGRTGASTATITRIASWLHHGTGGYRGAPARPRGRAAPAPGAGPRAPPRAAPPPRGRRVGR